MKWDEMIEKVEAWSPVALPRAHFMATAPLDVWARVLFSPGARIPPRYWLRLAACLFASSIAMAVTLPERLVLGPVLRREYEKRRRAGTPVHGPGAVTILGYFRSGTTHLHNLMSCDPNLVAPRWHQAMVPTGFVFSWTFYRLFLIAFLSQKRPQDDVAFGPEWPGEDDFALANWSATSSLIGRHVVTGRYEFYRRFDSLEGLGEEERERWRRTMWGFAWKVAAVDGMRPHESLRSSWALTSETRKVRDGSGRALLLKTPSHTAHPEALREVFAPAAVKFVHISREPREVIESNAAMHRRLRMFYLQNPPSEEVVRQRIVEDYLLFEERYCAAKERMAKAGAGAANGSRESVAEIRFEDLRADPMGQLRRVYGELEMEFSEEMERRVATYLESVGDYRPGTRVENERGSAAAGEDGRIDVLRKRFGHDREAMRECSASLRATSLEQKTRRGKWRGIGAAVCAAVACLVAWLVIANVVRNRYDCLVWPTGVMIGYAALRAARVGTIRLGLVAAALTVLVLIAVAFPNTWTIYYKWRADVLWADVWQTTKLELTAGPTIFWAFVGSMTAYRFASRTRAHPPR